MSKGAYYGIATQIENGYYIQLNEIDEQLEIYETEEGANRAVKKLRRLGCTKDLEVIELSVERVKP